MYIILQSQSPHDKHTWLNAHLQPILILAMSFLAGCGGGGNSTPAVITPPPPVTTPPQSEFAILSSLPVDTATNVSRSSGLAVTLSAAPDPSSINAGSVSLRGPQGNLVPGTLSVSGNEIRLQPTVALPGGTQYAFNFAASIKNVAGRSLNAASVRTLTARYCRQLPVTIFTISIWQWMARAIFSWDGHSVATFALA